MTVYASCLDPSFREVDCETEIDMGDEPEEVESIDNIPRQFETYEFVWSGIRIQIKFERKFLSGTTPGLPSHLGIESLEPARAPLPITQTGFRSHFPPLASIEERGGPVAYVLAWLDEEAKSRDWRAKQAAARQLSLF